MKRMILVLIMFLIAAPMFSQKGSNTKTGWRKDAVLSYCEEYDLMVGDGGYWVIDWNQSKDDIRRMLIRDGFKVQETDSTLDWTQTQIYSCSMRFKPDGKISFANTIITVSPKHGPPIVNSLKKKYDLINGDISKLQPLNNSIGYTWTNDSCKQTIYTMLANQILDDGKYFISVFTSRIGN